jgi:hypothetical protein
VSRKFGLSDEVRIVPDTVHFWNATSAGDSDQRVVGPNELRKVLILDLCRIRLVLKHEIRENLAQITTSSMPSSRFRISLLVT